VTRILVVDDDPGLARALAINLRARKYDVDVAGSGADALRIAARTRPDAVILDLGLPDMDGTEVVAGLRGWTSTPILVLSARHDQVDKVGALDAGADDYVTKPFGMDELLARLRAALRRAGAVADVAAAVLVTASFSIDLAAKRVTRDGQDVRLTPTEWHLLEQLARNPGRLVTQRQLLREVWGPAAEQQSQYLRVYIGTLRRKLEPVPARPRHLITEPGMGYRLEV
jgi:two-component system KDP operon response regulator KdpE